jgi:hypothetical protein
MRRAIVVGAILATSGLIPSGPALAQAQAPAPRAAAPAQNPAPKPAAPRPATPAPPPARAPSAAPAASAAAFDIKGFRSATFGMTPAQVKIAITADFGPTAKIQEGANPADGTQFILASVDHLDPGPGTAQVGYVFGAASKTLATINVVWSTAADATDPQRAAIAEAGQRIAAYFRAGPAPAKVSNGVGTFGANGLLLYTAVDRKNAGVQVMIDGVAYESTSGDKKVASPPPKGPATLRVAYSQDVDKPDTKALKPGSF